MNATTDALQTAFRQLDTEQAAVARCEAEGWTRDARFARQEVTRLQALIQRLRGGQ